MFQKMLTRPQMKNYLTDHFKTEANKLVQILTTSLQWNFNTPCETTIITEEAKADFQDLLHKNIDENCIMKSKEIHEPTIIPDGSWNNLCLGVSNKDYKVCEQDYKQSISEKIFQVSAKERALQWDFITPDEKPNAKASKPEFMASVQDNAAANFKMTCDELDEPSTVPVTSLQLPGPEVGNTNSNDPVPENVFLSGKKGCYPHFIQKRSDYVNQVLPEKRNEYTYSSIQ